MKISAANYTYTDPYVPHRDIYYRRVSAGKPRYSTGIKFKICHDDGFGGGSMKKCARVDIASKERYQQKDARSKLSME